MVVTLDFEQDYSRALEYGCSLVGEEAEDCVQTAFEKVHKKATVLAKQRAYAKKVVWSLSRRLFKKRNLHFLTDFQELEGDSSGSQGILRNPSSDSPLDSLFKKELHEALFGESGEVSRLSPALQRGVFEYLRSEFYGIPMSVRGRKSLERAKKELRKSVQLQQMNSDL